MVNHNGVVRLQVTNPEIVTTQVGSAVLKLQQLIDDSMTYEDGGKQLPGTFLVMRR